MADERQRPAATRELDGTVTNAREAADQLESMLEITRLAHRARRARQERRQERPDETPAD